MNPIGFDCSSHRQATLLLDLPTEMITEIFGYLDAKALAAASRTCRLFYALESASEKLWESPYFQDWKYLPENCSFYSLRKHSWKGLYKTRKNLQGHEFQHKMQSYNLDQVEHTACLVDHFYAIANNEKYKLCVFKAHIEEETATILTEIPEGKILGFPYPYIIYKRNGIDYKRIEFDRAVPAQFSLRLLNIESAEKSEILIAYQLPTKSKVIVKNEWVFYQKPNSPIVYGQPLNNLEKQVTFKNEIFSGGLLDVEIKNGGVLFQFRNSILYYVADPNVENPVGKFLSPSFFPRLAHSFIRGNHLLLISSQFDIEVWDVTNEEQVPHVNSNGEPEPRFNIKQRLGFGNNETLRMCDYDGSRFALLTNWGSIIILDSNFEKIVKWFDNCSIHFLKLIGENCITADTHANIKIWDWNRQTPTGLWHIKKSCHDIDVNWLMDDISKLVYCDFDGQRLTTVTADGCFSVLDF